MTAKPASHCDLQTCFLCRHTGREWRARIAGHKTNIAIKKGQKIFGEGERVKGVYFVYSGKVKVHKRWDAEKELILKFASTGDILGYRGLGKHKIYPVSATALESTIVCFVALAFFEDSLKANHGLTYDLMKLYANELEEAETRLRDLAHMEVKGRLADALLQLKKQFGLTPDGYINITLTRQNLASYAGATYETIFRMMTELIDNRVIRVNGKNIAIVNERKLKKLAQVE